ncbi:uncharacterized protein TNCV_931581 [Trichonephila clavipes]|uniref:Mutator-like transposase domain-containing protein n=1 Tax=Trichonephila clavipes TaxID=2585209 RepID=A0A8X7BE10_TRICX|nr:uncharacterized protein TNCV_931581 [Trichonephila clavipes]
MMEKVIENWTSRLDYIRTSRGSPMPNIIFKIAEWWPQKPSGQGIGWWLDGHEFESSTTKDLPFRGTMHVTSVASSKVLPLVVRKEECHFTCRHRHLTMVQHYEVQKIELREDLKSRRGIAMSLEIICHNCGESKSTMSSKISNKCYDVNLRLTYGMRAIGKGGAAARIFCGLMNLPPPPANDLKHHEKHLGDDDSKRFLTIKEAKVYGNTEVEKLEFVGHVQKRMGTRLRNILKTSKGIKLSDGENISGRGRLTLKEVDSIQHYYGLAICKNLSSVEDMKRATWAIYFHKLSTEDNPQHAL